MSVKTKKRFKNLEKKAGVIFFLLLMFTNINLILFDDNFSLNHFNFVSDIIAKQAQAGDGNGGGGGTEHTRFVNYGSQMERLWCQKTTVSNTGITTITFYVGYVWYKVEKCETGGTMHECALGTVRKTYEGGGC